MDRLPALRCLLALVIASYFAATCGGSSSSKSPSVSPPTAALAATTTTSPTVKTSAPPPTVVSADSTLLVANQMPTLPSGDPGTVAVLAIGESNRVDRTLPVVLRNNTDYSVTRIKLSGTARAADGALLASGEDQGVQPRVVAPGAIAFGFVYFGIHDAFPPGVKFEVKATFKSGSTDDYFLPLHIVEFNQVGDRIVGLAKNNHAQTVKGPLSVDAMCFDNSGVPLSTPSDYADADEIPPDGTTGFTLELRGGACPIFIIAGSGYSE